jgi:RNA polymerase sigma-70 factor, ECF subfamily
MVVLRGMASRVATDPDAGTDAGAGFEELVRHTAPKLLAYFVRRLDDREDAADCVAETFIVLWRKQAHIPQDEDAARAWVFGIARNVLRLFHRGRVRRTALAERLRFELHDEHIPAPDAALSEALGALNRADAELVLLVAWEGFGVAEAGGVLGLSAEAARKRYSRAREALRRVLSNGERGTD